MHKKKSMSKKTHKAHLIAEIMSSNKSTGVKKVWKFLLKKQRREKICEG